MTKPPQRASSDESSTYRPKDDVVTQPEIRDSRKPWAVLVQIRNSGKIQPEQTRYFWTGWGARRYAGRIGDGEFYRLKVVRNA